MKKRVPEAAPRRKSALPFPSAKDLLAWYDRHRRVLPWRAGRGEKADPYKVWLSEIMLQQTTVAAVGPYFQKFLKRWPDVHALAAADLEDIRKYWAGLGYYRRAVSLHRAARVVSHDLGGRFPCDQQALLELPGIGPYTSAAIAAIAFDQRANVVDGNVERVVARLFAVKEALPAAKTLLRDKAGTLLPDGRYGDYAQAMMDLGATICTPRSPQCGLCPFAASCEARAEGKAETYPLKAKKKAKPHRTAFAFVAMHPTRGVFLRQRAEAGLLAGMAELPSSPWREDERPELEQVLDHSPDPQAVWHEIEGSVLHVFTHFELELGVACATFSTRQADRVAKKGRWVPLRDLDGEALPSVMRKILRVALHWKK